ncbi:MAG TPA: metallophosphoesterase family protein, partial [Bdellovibrionota bacterium]|nr:metallophosphoesterase family protein [Bdellovibrionota bacterium]
MKSVALISDIHGNYPALRAVLDDIDRVGATQIVCLGDIVGFFSMVNECVELLRKRGIVCLKGNHDHALVFDRGVIPRSKTCTQVLHRQMSELKPDHVEWLGKLEARLDLELLIGPATLVHGGLDNPVDEYLYKVPLD